MNRFTVSTELSASPQSVYYAWLNSEQHSEMTQSPASASTEVAGIFTVHDGYINGINLELEDAQRILQTCRTSQFEGTDPDSSIEIILEKVANGTLLTLKQWNIPEGQAEGYESGWHDFYFTPMQEFFSNKQKL
jgi:activator of HSP90 ATPase